MCRSQVPAPAATLLQAHSSALNYTSGMLQDRLHQSDQLSERLSRILDAGGHDGTPRSTSAAALCAIALEHGYSIRALIELDHLTSAIALLRIQFEAVVRSLWVHFAASEEWASKLAALIESRSLKEPAAP